MQVLNNEIEEGFIGKLRQFEKLISDSLMEVLANHYGIQVCTCAVVGKGHMLKHLFA